MADFNTAVEVVLQHEGGVGTLAGDPGGKTCFGWSEPTCTALGIEQPETLAAATVLYHEHFWNPLYEKITSQNVATKLLDDCVNQGTRTGVRNLQRALTAAGSIVNIDGSFGPATLTAVNLVPESLLLPWMRLIQYQTYETWIGTNPDRLKLKHGMANRAAWPDADGTIAAALMNGTYNPSTGTEGLRD